MLNVAAVMGRITADPELKHTPNGVAVCSFTLAVERSYAPQGQERQADFIDVVAWRGTAEFVSKYFTKGRMMAVDGSIQTRSYEDKNGNKRKSVEIVASNVSFAGDSRRDGGGSGTGAGGYSTQASQPAHQPVSAPQPAYSAPTQPQEDYADVLGDDLPF